jgi:hypothetical protein
VSRAPPKGRGECHAIDVGPRLLGPGNPLGQGADLGIKLAEPAVRENHIPAPEGKLKGFQEIGSFLRPPAQSLSKAGGNIPGARDDLAETFRSVLFN